MAKIDELKEKFNQLQTSWESEAENTKREKEKAQAVVDACTADMNKALEDGTPEKYMEAKAKRVKSIGIVEFYTTKLERIESEKQADLAGLEPFFVGLYKNTMAEYRKACQECLDAIEELKKASGKAEAIVKEYEMCTGFASAYIYHTQQIFDGRVQREFPNKNAFDLTRNLAFAVDCIKRFLST